MNGAVDDDPPRLIGDHPDRPRLGRLIIDPPRLPEGRKLDPLRKSGEGLPGGGGRDIRQLSAMGLDPGPLFFHDRRNPAEVEIQGHDHRKAVFHGELQTHTPRPRGLPYPVIDALNRIRSVRAVHHWSAIFRASAPPLPVPGNRVPKSASFLVIV